MTLWRDDFVTWWLCDVMTLWRDDFVTWWLCDMMTLWCVVLCQVTFWQVRLWRRIANCAQETEKLLVITPLEASHLGLRLRADFRTLNINQLRQRKEHNLWPLHWLFHVNILVSIQHGKHFISLMSFLSNQSCGHKLGVRWPQIGTQVARIENQVATNKTFGGCKSN